MNKKTEPAHGACELIEDLVVEHAAYVKGWRRLEQCFRYAMRGNEPICMAVVGESGTGKSRLLEEFEREHPAFRNADGLEMPVLRIKTPSKPTVKGLVEEMLNKLEDPVSKRTSEQRMTARLRKLVEECNTKVVCVDEFQHFRDKVSNKVAHYVADWLKVLADESNVALVVAGLPICKSVIHQNEQLARRFRGAVVMPRFDWNKKDDREEFLGILLEFDKRIRQGFDLPELASADMGFRLYCASGGLLGYVVNILQQAVLDADFDDRREIQLSHFEEALQAGVWEGSKLETAISPFSPKFCAMAVPELLAKVAMVGLPLPEPPTPLQRRAAKTESNVNPQLAAS